MRAGYIDSSCLVAQLFGEPGGTALADRIAEFDVAVASPLLEAEVRSAAAREDVLLATQTFGALTWILPARSLGAEITRVLEAGHVRGADAWHLACALYFFEGLPAVFLTLDARQRVVAQQLGFAVD